MLRNGFLEVIMIEAKFVLATSRQMVFRTVMVAMLQKQGALYVGASLMEGSGAYLKYSEV